MGKKHDYESMRRIGKEALDKLEINLKVRGEIAIKVAQAAYCVNDSKLMEKCWYEAFYSNSIISNYLRLFISEKTIDEYKKLAEKRAEEIPVFNEGYYSGYSNETIENNITDIEKKYLYFFLGHFDKIKSWSMGQNEVLGWTGKFIGRGINLMLLYLYDDKHLRKAIKDIAGEVLFDIGFNNSKDLLFMKENYIFERDINIKDDEETFWKVFCLWKRNYKISKEEVKDYIDWLESVIDKRIDAIVGGKYRRKYNEVARLAAALGEAKESIEGEEKKQVIIDRYMKEYPRHSAFKAELRKYV